MKYIIFSCLVLTSSLLHAQTIVTSSGGEATGSGGTISYTIGQIDYISADGQGSADMGVQHAYKYQISGIDDFSRIELVAAMSPNPTSHTVTLKLTDLLNKSLSYKLFDINRKLLLSDRIQSEETIIPLQHLPAATYLLTVQYRNTVLKTFRVIKE